MCPRGCLACQVAASCTGLPPKPIRVRLCVPLCCAGVTIVDGDCHVDVAANTTLKILTLLDRRDVPVAVSSLQAANPFPAPYRSQGLILDVLPVLNQKPSDVADLRHRQLQKQSGQEYFAQLLLQQQQKVTIVATGKLHRFEASRLFLQHPLPAKPLVTLT